MLWKEKELYEFASKRTKRFFEILGEPCSFLGIDPELWTTNEDYKNLETIVSKVLDVTNDAAERGVKLMVDYHCKLTTDEDQKQALFQMVAYYRKTFPTIRVGKV